MEVTIERKCYSVGRWLVYVPESDYTQLLVWRGVFYGSLQCSYPPGVAWQTPRTARVCVLRY